MWWKRLINNPQLTAMVETPNLGVSTSIKILNTNTFPSFWRRGGAAARTWWGGWLFFLFKGILYFIQNIFRFLKYKPVFEPKYCEARHFKIFVSSNIFLYIDIILMGVSINFYYKFFLRAIEINHPGPELSDVQTDADNSGHPSFKRRGK